MTYIITGQCIGCHRCESVCPSGAISQNEQQYHYAQAVSKQLQPPTSVGANA